MKKVSPIVLFIGLVFIVPAVAYGLLSVYEKNWQRLPVIKQGAVADFSMINQDGKEITVENWDNKIVVVDFFFTHCASICPKMTMNLKKVNSNYKEDTRVGFASFSVDPERDSAAQLKKYAARFEITWDLLTGDKKEIYKLARNSFMIVATDGDGGPNDFIHSEKLVLLDKHRRIRGYYDGTSEKETDQLIRDIKKIKYED